MKIWQIKGRSDKLILTDEELIIAIKKGFLVGDDVIVCPDLKQGIAIKDSLYAFYLGEDDEQE